MTQNLSIISLAERKTMALLEDPLLQTKEKELVISTGIRRFLPMDTNLLPIQNSTILFMQKHNKEDYIV